MLPHNKNIGDIKLRMRGFVINIVVSVPVVQCSKPFLDGFRLIRDKFKQWRLISTNITTSLIML